MKRSSRAGGGSHLVEPNADEGRSAASTIAETSAPGTMLFAFMILVSATLAGGAQPSNPRERLLMDFDWRFALGHAADVSKDFDHAAGEFSYFAKTGYAAGASKSDYDDHGWRRVNLPHDWAIELPFDPRGSTSHGSKAIGRNFPENSVGWYRRHFKVPASDLGKRISVEFDGVFRDSRVWINGHFLGREESGYTSFAYNLTEFLNYGGDNLIAVRVDASLEEGWFYEGAGIYRHVWLVKTSPVHVQRHGTFVTSRMGSNSAEVVVQTTVVNEGSDSKIIQLKHAIEDPNGNLAAGLDPAPFRLGSGDSVVLTHSLVVTAPQLWSIEEPRMYQLFTTLETDGVALDVYETPFGIRSIRFDPDSGFSLNGRPVKLKGTNNHQDHAGVGVALPDGLQEFRIAQLKKLGCNAYRCSHHPPTPELLEACDRLGMLVIDENRLMGTTDFHLRQLTNLMLRDRNHPSIILWSLGNEEWRIEGTDVGTRVTSAMQTHAGRMDPTRPTTLAISGGWGRGSSLAIDVAGFNYIGNGDTDKQHARMPRQPIVGTEECAFTTTRGVYFDDQELCHLRAYDWDPSSWGSSAEEGWTHYARRPELAGMFVWTGFDYRGEPTPFKWPAISSQFGILDTCGFPKDAFHYFQAWWTDSPVLHLFPHWNWPERVGQPIPVWAYSNCDEVELFLNGQSLGRQTMKKDSHLEWNVTYAPGSLSARGFRDGREIARCAIETTGPAAQLRLLPHQPRLRANREDVTAIAVQVRDADDRLVPTAANEVTFQCSGPARILGVGNGDPSSHEPDTFVLSPEGSESTVWKRRAFNGLAQLILQASGTPGEIRVTASAEGIPPTVLRIQSESAPHRPAAP